MLPLFPDGTGVMTLELMASDTFLAGLHELQVVVRSSVHPDETLALPLEAEVVAVPVVTLRAEPSVRSGRHRATFQLVSSNKGNVPLDIALVASDPEKAVLSRFTPAHPFSDTWARPVPPRWPFESGATSSAATSPAPSP